jgi:hypothetical protein
MEANRSKGAPPAMRRLLLVTLLALAGCVHATASRIDSRTFRIQGPGIPGGSDVPNKRLAEQLCPGGYRLLHQSVMNNTNGVIEDLGSTFTNWTIRCI